jgi:hypothetical protein
MKGDSCPRPPEILHPTPGHALEPATQLTCSEADVRHGRMPMTSASLVLADEGRGQIEKLSRSVRRVRSVGTKWATHESVAGRSRVIEGSARPAAWRSRGYRADFPLRRPSLRLLHSAYRLLAGLNFGGARPTMSLHGRGAARPRRPHATTTCTARPQSSRCSGFLIPVRPAGGHGPKLLGERISDLPRVLAGPVLRKVAPRSVTVRLVLRMRADVTLTVPGPHDVAVPSGTGSRGRWSRRLGLAAAPLLDRFLGRPETYLPEANLAGMPPDCANSAYEAIHDARSPSRADPHDRAGSPRAECSRVRISRAWLGHGRERSGLADRSHRGNHAV